VPDRVPRHHPHGAEGTHREDQDHHAPAHLRSRGADRRLPADARRQIRLKLTGRAARAHNVTGGVRAR